MDHYITINPRRNDNSEIKKKLRIEVASLQKALAGLLILSASCNAATVSALIEEREGSAELSARHQVQMKQVEQIRDEALEQLGTAVLQAKADKQARAEQAAAYEAVGAYRYIGECVITAYCPCEECCGKWADGLTATGFPAGPGIVAVDPEVIPFGSTVVIDGQKYLAADTGVTGLHVDIFTASHDEAEAFGLQSAEVWVAEQ